MEDFVTVSVRIKPTSNNETGSSLQVISKQPAVLLVLNKGQTYHFDNIFTDETNQENIYNDTVRPFVERVQAGYNCTVFAYGQTGTGKTYTIGTNPDIKNYEDCGLIQRTLDDFFNLCPDDNSETKISISFIEIYNEMVFDLLTPKTTNKAPLTIKGFKVQGFQRVTIENTLEGLTHLKVGSRQRHTGETKENSNSSRSHAIFSIYCHTMEYGGTETLAKLNLVDLAGSESVKKTGNQGASFHEGININKGLLSLGQVMTALSTNSNYVPYRQSIITTTLQDSLNKKNFISLIACISPNLDDLGETLQTLDFSSRVKKLKNKPEVNEVISEYKKYNPTLFVGNNRGLTPSKRTTSAYKYETPLKKPRANLPVIQEPTSFGGNDKLGELSLLAHPLFSSSVASSICETPQNLSPVIKKYINAMEVSIISKLENVIQKTLRRSKRVSRQGDKENVGVSTPVQLYRSGSSRSTPLNNTVEFMNESYKNVTESSKVASFEDSLKNNQNNSTPLSSPEKPKTDTDDVQIFKVPEPVTAIKSKNVVRRSSIRLQNKSILTDATNFDHGINQSSRRRSVRLQIKNNTDATNRRRSVRLQLKKNDEKKNVSPCSTCKAKRKSPIKNIKKTASPVTLRTKQVLDILNNGSVRELAKLHTIGTKTAENILLYREVKGKFESVNDIVNIPYWTQKKCDKFLSMNFARS